MDTSLSSFRGADARAEAVQRTIHGFLHTDRLHRAAIDRALADLGIHRSQHRMLMHIQRAAGRISQKRLGEELDISPAAVAVTLRKLERHGYLRRTADADDGRCKTIEITPRGAEVLKAGRSAFTEVDLLMFSRFSEEDLALFSDLLSRMRAALVGEVEP